MKRYATLTDVIDREIAPALADYSADYDLEEIARQTFTWAVDTDDQGHELLPTAGFEQTVDDDEFWIIVDGHRTT